MSLLELENVVTAYGKVEALKGLTLHVEQGEIVALLGSNGAGKSTTLRSISGLIRPRSGTMRFPVLLVEQNAHMALSIGDRGYVLETGRLVAEGNPETLWNNAEVRAAYLGGRKTEK
jgi:ABC-type branched-subunit amino acid transport system ATPase component